MSRAVAQNVFWKSVFQKTKGGGGGGGAVEVSVD